MTDQPHVKVAARRSVESRTNTRCLNQLFAVGLCDVRAKLREVVVGTLGRSGTNREVLTNAFRVETKRASVKASVPVEVVPVKPVLLALSL